VRQLLGKDNDVIAAVRNPDAAAELKKLKAENSKQLNIISLDVADMSSIAMWASKVAESYEKVDVCAVDFFFFRCGHAYLER
jgi:NADP-dependent 3-hydroxy acid dehydrogenase YdfG